MDRLQSMQVFIAVAESLGFAPAARKLYMSPPAVTRAIAGLEDRLGVILFHRTTRQVKLTEAGQRFLEDCRRILADLHEAEESAAGAHKAPRGKLSITASVRFGHVYILPLIFEFLNIYPEVAIRSFFVDRVVNLIDEGLDIAIRIGELPDSNLTAIWVGAVRRVICASPGYLEMNGIPQIPDEIGRHEIIHFEGLSSRPEWCFKCSDAETTVAFKYRLAVNSANDAIAAAIAGHGLIQVLSYQVAQEIKSGYLKVVLSDYETESIPIHVVYQEGRKASARIRAFVDFAVHRLRNDESIN
jgi:DNA-binding transcriptional LysR family regulator